MGARTVVGLAFGVGVFLALGGAPASAQSIDPSQLEIVVGRAGVNESGFLHIVGEVRNKSKDWLYKPRLRIDFFDPAGQPIRSESIATAVAEDKGMEPHEFVYTDHGFIAPGASGLFHFIRDTSKIKGKYGSHKLSVATARKVSAAPSVEIEGLDIKKDSDSDKRNVVGRIKSKGPMGCISAQAIIALYSAEGKLVKVETERPEGSYGKALAAGQTLAFRTGIWPEDGFSVGTIKVWGDCEIE